MGTTRGADAPTGTQGAARRAAWAAAVTAAALATAGSAQAQTAPEGPARGGASPGSQADTPTDKPELRAFCTDRPGQGYLPCTVDAGRWQVETDVVNVTYDRSAGQETYLFSDPTVKLGVTSRSDVEVSFTPYEEVRGFASPGSPPRDVSGFGDVLLRFKQNIFGDYKGPLAVAVEPYVKLPTARRGVGDGAWEGGVIAPFAVGLSKALVLNFTSELDVRKDQASADVHVEEFGVANVTLSLPRNFGLLLEVAARHSGDPSADHTQVFSDVALSLALPRDAEIDVGVNHGLNRRTPADQVYLGLAKRF